MKSSIQTGGANAVCLHPLVRHLIYGDIGEMPLNVLCDECPTQDDYHRLDVEQDTRLQAAATVQAWFEGRLHKGGYLHDHEIHAEADRVPNAPAHRAEKGNHETT